MGRPFDTERGVIPICRALLSWTYKQGVLPTAKLSAAISAGDTTLTLPTAGLEEHLREGMLLWFLDGGPGNDDDDPEIHHSENVNPVTQLPGPLPIDSIDYDTGVVTPSWRGRSWSAFQADHAEGALVGWNSATTDPARTDQWLDLGDANVWIFPSQERTDLVAGPNVNRWIRMICLVYSIKYQQAEPLTDDDALDPNLWSDDQQNRAHLHMKAIQDGLLSNRGIGLNVNGETFAEDLADPSGQRFSVNWANLLNEAEGTAHLRVELNVMVRTRKAA